jgi:hypothetical protein
MTGGIVPSG